MSDATVLFVKPKAISAADKKALRAAGIVVVEIEDPQSVKLVRAGFELSHGDLLSAAAKAINESGYSEVRSLFGRAVSAAIMAAHPPANPDSKESE